MEKIITVKQEPLEDGSSQPVAKKVIAPAQGQPAQTLSLAETAVALKTNPVLLFQPRKDGSPQRCVVVSSASTPQGIFW